jgi:hypothetical protein
MATRKKGATGEGKREKVAVELELSLQLLAD